VNQEVQVLIIKSDFSVHISKLFKMRVDSLIKLIGK